mgnify:CR=1 FL=1
MPIPLALTVASGVAGVVNHLANKPKNNNFDFSFNRQNVDYNANPDLLASMASLNQTADSLGSAGNQFMNQYNELTDPNSETAQAQRARLTTSIGDSTQQQNRIAQQAIASTGGPASLGNLLRTVNNNQANEAIFKGSQDFEYKNLQSALGFGNLASSTYGRQAGAQGQAGQFANAMDSRQLQTDMENTRSENNYNQYLRTSQYNQMLGNQQARANYNRGTTDSLLNFSGFGYGNQGSGFGEGGNSTWFGSGIDGLLGIGGGG